MTLQFTTFWAGDTCLTFHEVYDEVADERWYKAIELITFLGFKDTDAYVRHHVKDESKQNWGSLCKALNIQLKAHEGIGRQQNAKEILEKFSSIPKNAIFINFCGLLELCFTTENPLLANTKRWMVNELGAKIKRLQSQPAQTIVSNTLRDTLTTILNGSGIRNMINNAIESGLNALFEKLLVRQQSFERQIQESRVYDTRPNEPLNQILLSIFYFPSEDSYVNECHTFTYRFTQRKIGSKHGREFQSGRLIYTSLDLIENSNFVRFKNEHLMTADFRSKTFVCALNPLSLLECFKFFLETL